MAALKTPEQEHGAAVRMPGGEPRIFAVGRAENGIRLDRFLAECLRGDGFSREKIKRLIREDKVRVNGSHERSPKALLRAGNEVSIEAERPPTSLTAETGDLDILYQDRALAVLNKPAGLTVHPAPGRPTGTLAHRLLSHFPALAAQEGERPGIVHRLDKDTSGIMLVALTEKCRLALSAMFAAHEVFKEYLALVHGVPGEEGGVCEGIIDQPVGRHPTRKTRMAVLAGGKAAKSAWRVLYADPDGIFSLVAVRIFSGRTHQVRVHMEHIGHPLLGDSLYGGTRSSVHASAGGALPAEVAVWQVAPRQMLHAWKLAFTHPLPEDALNSESRALVCGDGNRLSFFCPPPSDFYDAVRACSYRTLQVVITGMPGCGKSALLAELRKAGVPVFSADAEVTRLYSPGGDGQRLLLSRFGSRFVPDAAKPVDKGALGAAMRENASLRREVEDLLHPLVRYGQKRFWEDQAALGMPFAVAEVPLYLETGRQGREQEKTSDLEPVLVGVHCPFAVRRERLMRNRHWDEETIARMESWQWPEEKKMQACDIIVDNTGSLDELAARTEDLIGRLEGIRREREEAVVRRVEALCIERAGGF